MDAAAENSLVWLAAGAALAAWAAGALGLSVWWALAVVLATHHAITRRLASAARSRDIARLFVAPDHPQPMDTADDGQSIRSVDTPLDEMLSALPRSRRLPLSFATPGEPAAWANALAGRLWAVVEPTLSAKLANQLNIALQEYVPAFLESWEMRELTLGSRPPHIVSARLVPMDERDSVNGSESFSRGNAGSNEVVVDMRIVYVPQKRAEVNTDASDGDESWRPVSPTSSDQQHTLGGSDASSVRSTSAASSMHWDARVVVGTRLRRGLLRAAVPLVFRDISVVGTVRVRLETAPVAPFVSRVQMAFVDAPVLDFGLAPASDALSLGGLLDLMDLPGLSRWLAARMDSTCAWLCVRPNYLTIPIDKLAALSSDVCAVGVVRITLWGLRLSSGVEGGTASPRAEEKSRARQEERGNAGREFVEVRIMHSGRVRAISPPASLATGEWAVSSDGVQAEKHVFHMLVHSRKHPIVFELGQAGGILDAQPRGGRTAFAHNLGDAGRSLWRAFPSARGAPELHYGIEVLVPLAADAPTDARAGIVNVSVWQVKDLLPVDGVQKRASHVAFEVVVKDDSQPPSADDARVVSPWRYRSRSRRRTALPSWDDVFEVFVEDVRRCSVCVRVLAVNGHSDSHEALLATWSSPLPRLLDRTDWFRFEDRDDAQFYASFLFRPVPSADPPAVTSVAPQPSDSLHKVVLRGIARQNQMTRAVGVLEVSLRSLVPAAGATNASFVRASRYASASTVTLSATTLEGPPVLEPPFAVRVDVNGAVVGVRPVTEPFRFAGESKESERENNVVCLARDKRDRLALELVCGEDSRVAGRAVLRLDEVLNLSSFRTSAGDTRTSLHLGDTSGHASETHGRDIAALPLRDAHGRELDVALGVHIALHPLAYDDDMLLAGVVDDVGLEHVAGRFVAPPSKDGSACGVLDIYRVEAVKLPLTAGGTYYARIALVPCVTGPNGERVAIEGAADPAATHATPAVRAMRHDAGAAATWDRLAQLVAADPRQAELRLSIHDAATHEALGAFALPLADARCDVPYPLVAGSGFVSVRMALHDVAVRLSPPSRRAGYAHVHVLDARLGSGSRRWDVVASVHVDDRRVHKTAVARSSSSPVFDEHAAAYVADASLAHVHVELRAVGRMRPSRMLGRTPSLRIDSAPLGVWSSVQSLPLSETCDSTLRLRLSFIPSREMPRGTPLPLPVSVGAVERAALLRPKSLASSTTSSVDAVGDCIETAPNAAEGHNACPTTLCVEVVALRGAPGDDMWRVKLRRAGRTLHKTPSSRACRWLDECLLVERADAAVLEVVAISAGGRMLAFEALDVPALLDTLVGGVSGKDESECKDPGFVCLRGRDDAEVCVEIECWLLPAAAPVASHQEALVQATVV